MTSKNKKPHWTQLPENQAKLAAIRAKRYAKPQPQPGPKPNVREELLRQAHEAVDQLNIEVVQERLERVKQYDDLIAQAEGLLDAPEGA